MNSRKKAQKRKLGNPFVSPKWREQSRAHSLRNEFIFAASVLSSPIPISLFRLGQSRSEISRFALRPLDSRRRRRSRRGAFRPLAQSSAGRRLRCLAHASNRGEHRGIRAPRTVSRPGSSKRRRSSGAGHCSASSYFPAPSAPPARTRASTGASQAAGEADRSRKTETTAADRNLPQQFQVQSYSSTPLARVALRQLCIHTDHRERPRRLGQQSKRVGRRHWEQQPRLSGQPPPSLPPGIESETRAGNRHARCINQ